MFSRAADRSQRNPSMFYVTTFACRVVCQATQKAEDRMKLTGDLVKKREMVISSLEAELLSYKHEVK